MAKKIVIVDDNARLSETMSMCLRWRGHSVQVCHGSADAYLQISAEQPDLLVLDPGLPDSDGWQLANLLAEREFTEIVPIIVVSIQDPDRRTLAKVRPYAYIQKPFDMGQLIQTVEKGLDEGLCLANVKHASAIQDEGGI
jgi:two-component system response regulator AtoC